MDGWANTERQGEMTIQQSTNKRLGGWVNNRNPVPTTARTVITMPPGDHDSDDVNKCGCIFYVGLLF
jgi:hypothetical protein